MERKIIFDEEIEHLVNSILKSGKTAGGFPAHISLLATDKTDDSRRGILYIPCSEFMKSDESKNLFIDTILPEVSKTIKDKYDITGLVFVSEVNIRIVEDADFIPENYKDIPVTFEGVNIAIETDEKSNILLYKIQKNGMKVVTNEESNISELVDDISLNLELCNEEVNHETFQGRFANLLKHFR